jgi:hypothetical protein
MGLRSYVPALGIFLQPDPVPNGSTTAYNYAAGDPINASDVSGQSAVWEASWWKANGGTVARIATAVVVATAVTALTAGTGTSVAATIMLGAIGGAAGGAAGDYLGQVAANYVNGAASDTAWTDVNWAEAGVAAAIGMVTGGVSSWIRASRTISHGIAVQETKGAFRFAGLGQRNTSNTSFLEPNFVTGEIVRSTPPGGLILQRYGSYGTMMVSNGAHFADDSLRLAEKALSDGGAGRYALVGWGIHGVGAGAGVAVQETAVR